MKTQLTAALVTTTLVLTSLAITGCGEKVGVAAPSLPSTKAVLAATTPIAAPVASLSPDVPSNLWTDIKDYTYDQRARFFPGFQLMEARVDAQLAELTARRAAMNSTVNTKDWDFAMKEMVDARSYLKSTGEVLGKATPETWQQEKEKVGQAWVRTQEAYRKVKSSTTS